MELMRIDPNKVRWCAVGIVLTFCASAAIAETPKAAKPSGVMTFPHVTVVNAPAKPATSNAAAGTAGARAYVDPVTGTLRAQTAEDRLQEAAAAKSRTALRAPSRAKTTLGVASEASSTEPEMIYEADGSATAMLTDEQMVFQVARKGSSGLARTEVTGKKAAEKAVNTVTEEVDNAR